MKRTSGLQWCLSLFVLLGCSGSLLAAAAQDEEPINGYGPWEFGMRHFQVANFEAFGPYLPVEQTGGLETRNGVFDGEKTNISFVFDDHGLEYVQIWAYEGREVDEMMPALYRIYRYVSERYGDLMLDGEKLVPGLGADGLAALIPDEFTRPLAGVSEDELKARGAARAQFKRVEIEPVWQPEGARVMVHLNRAEALGATYVMLFYSRPGEPVAVELDGAIEGVTGPAEVVDTSGYLQVRMIGADEYAQRAGDSALLARYADLHSNPEAYFLQLSLGPSRAVMAIVGNFSSGFELRAMPPAVEAPTELRFARDEERFVLTAELAAQERGPEGLSPYPVSLRLVMHPEDGPDRARVYALGMRRGVVNVDGRELEFGIAGDFGIFNGWNDPVYFDLDGNGVFSRARNSSERYRVYDGYVTVDGKNWRFDVDRLGEKISLAPLDGSYPARAALDEGAVAPDFSFVGRDGAEHRLSDYRGKVVLLDFWGAWCGPCRGEAPHLVDAYERYRDAGFEIIGIDYKDSEEAQLAFMEEFGMSWPQARESDSDRPIHDLYRNWTWPTHYLIDEDGVIIDFNPRGGKVLELLEERFGR